MEGLVSVDEKTVLPLKDISVQVNVKGYLVGISSNLCYSNDTSNPVEVAFRFPLEESFAVVGLDAVIDGRKIKGEVKEKQKARDMYDNAIASGMSAAYAEEKSGDIFSLSLGNLPSGSEAQISIKMVGELPIEPDGRVRFALPSVLKPRYTPEDSIDPLAAAPNPSVKHASIPGVFKFRMIVEGSAKVAGVSSPSHKLKIDQTPDCAVNVCIADEGPLKGDVTILIEYKDPHEPMAIVEQPREGSKSKEMKSKAVMLNFFPKFTSVDAACEFIFVVDRSGSMRGSYIKSASETLVLFLKSIPEGCYFNIVSFGSRFESFFPSSQPYNQETMEKATKFAEKMQADFGGTELLAPLQSIFKQKPQSSGLPRQVFILTDGSVSNTDRVISEVRKNSHSTRCFTFGIGSGASTALVKGIARAGNGSSEFIADNERMQSKVICSLKKALQPSANDVAVIFELPSNYQVKVVPEKIPNIFNGEKTVIYGLLMENLEQKGEGLKCKATLTGNILGEEFKFEIPFELTEEQSEEDVSVIHQLAVKKMIQEWQDDEEPYEQKHKKEIIELSTDASVVSRYTAYIAVDVAQNKPVSGSMQSYELTATNAGMHNVAMGGMFMPPAPGTLAGAFQSFKISFDSAPPPPAYIEVDVAQNKPVSGSLLSYELTATNAGMYDEDMFMAPAPGIFADTLQSFEMDSLSFDSEIDSLSFDSAPPPPPRGALSYSCPPPPPSGAMGGGIPTQRSGIPTMAAMQEGGMPTRHTMRAMGGGKPTLLSSNIRNENLQMPLLTAPVKQRRSVEKSKFGMQSSSSPAKQTGVNFIVSLQQANGSWLLSDQLASVVSKSVEELKSCCPVSCDDILIANIWATLVVIELLKKKYPSMLEELELVIQKAEQWVGKHPLPSGVNLTTLKESASKLF